jgi:DNA-binding beta-propeller fold protein YncE
VQTFDLWDNLRRIVRGGPPFNRPTGVSISPNDEIYVSDGYGNARIHKFNADGKLLLSWGEPGGDAGQFQLPHSVRVDKRGWVWVADRENHRIQIFDANGKFLKEWTNLLRPTDIFIDNHDTVYVSELSNRVSIFAMDGKLLARWGNTGITKEEALFIAPHAIAVDSHGGVYVGQVSMTYSKVDRGPRTIQKFSRIT